MRTLKTICAIFLLAATIPISGQEATTIEKAAPYIEVTGTAEKEIVPDEIYISIIIRERHDGREEVSIEQQEEELKAAIARVGVPLENLSLSDASGNFRRVRWTKKDVITKTEYILKVKDALTIKRVFDELDNAEELDIDNVYVSAVSHSEIDRLKQEVRIGAIKAAKDKADYLLTAIDAQTGRPLIVKEEVNLPLSEMRGVNARLSQYNYNDYYEIDGGSYKSTAGKVAIGYRKIKLQSSVHVKFEIQ